MPPLLRQSSRTFQIFLPRTNKEMPFVIEAEIEGLNLSNNKIQSLEQARLPVERGSFFRPQPHAEASRFPPRVPGVPDDGYAVKQSLDLRLCRPRLQETALLEIELGEY
ncbi:hypothetical protein CEXT_357761 [Caerostris extrusa]|uniref:Uncharacterized protein n=1 Tax=Caerostris extrusa TaxID=172846 RepID=A0AAV4UI35_CAEEX|nr:hypothetical protein CEXT_357761 [Caerostris extrusa]